MPRKQREIRDRSGQRFGRLVVVALHHRDDKWRDHFWLCRCDCGATKIARTKNLTSGHTTSCGCAFHEMVVARNTKHGLTGSHRREYRSWKDMRSRCRNESHKDYKDYGGRGVKICAQWEDFAVFYADMGARPDGATLDRIDVNGDYDPKNCRWADAMTQANNKRSNRRVSINGEALTLMQASRRHGIDRTKLDYRLKHGYHDQRAVAKHDYRKNGQD